MHLSLAAETLFSIGGFPVTNSLLAAVMLVCTLCVLALLLRRTGMTVQNGWYNAVEAAVEGLEGLVKSVVGSGSLARRIVPLAGTFFVFIVLANWTGIMPFVGSVGLYHEKPAAAHEAVAPAHEAGAAAETTETAAPHEGAAAQEEVAPTHGETVAAPAAHEEAATADADAHAAPAAHGTVFAPLLRSIYSDLNMTLALAIISVFMTQVFGFQELGMAYAKKFLTLSNPIHTFVGLLEIISEFVKIFSFSFRLFGNIFAGEVLLTVIGFLVPFVGPVPFLGIELFAGAIQALIFTMLTLVFISGAVTAHDEHHDEHHEGAHHAPAHA